MATTNKPTKDLAAAPLFIRTQFNYDHNAASNASGLSCQEPTRAQQHHKEECDINEILRRFGKTGVMPVNTSEALFPDFTDAVDYHTALNQIIASEREFDLLPSNLRKRFDNDPAKLVYFMQDKKNHAEAVELGLINAPKSEPTAPKTPVTDTPE
jgi:phage internal scaffolding protein